MTDEVPFSEAERVFNKVQDLVEAHVQYLSPGAGEVNYSFGLMAGLVEHRHIGVHYSSARGGEGRFLALLPESTGYWRLDGHDIRLNLTGQEVELLTDLVWLGACTGFWYVENLADTKGNIKQLPRHGVAWMREHTNVEPIALMVAFASGELESVWPHRKDVIEKGWFIWHARFQALNANNEMEIAAQGYGRAAELWTPEASVDVPDYLA